jgi:hypothetical protein
MKKYILTLLLFLTACASGEYPAGTPTATPNPGEIALNMIQQQMAAEATSQIVGLQFTATAEVLGITATSQAVSTSEAITQQARIDAQATSDQARRDAAATQARQDAIATAERQQVLSDAATEQARKDAQSSTEQAMIAIQDTQSAFATSTFTVMTLTAMPAIGTATALGMNNQIVIDGKNMEKAELELQQARDTNKISWAVPLLVALVALGAGLLYVVRKSRWNPIMDDNGELAGFGFDETFVRPHALPGAVLDLKAKPIPLLMDAATQKELLVNEQKIRAIAAMPVNPSAGGAQAFNMAFGSVEQKPRFAMLEEGERVPANVMTPEAEQSIDADWKESNE